MKSKHLAALLAVIISLQLLPISATAADVEKVLTVEATVGEEPGKADITVVWEDEEELPEGLGYYYKAGTDEAELTGESAGEIDSSALSDWQDLTLDEDGSGTIDADKADNVNVIAAISEDTAITVVAYGSAAVEDPPEEPMSYKAACDAGNSDGGELSDPAINVTCTEEGKESEEAEAESEEDGAYKVYINITGSGKVQTLNAASDEWQDAVCISGVRADTCAIAKVTADAGNEIASIYANGEALTAGDEGLVEIPVGSSDVVVDVAFIDENAEYFSVNPALILENILGLTISAEDGMVLTGDTVYVSADADPDYAITDITAIPDMPETSVETTYDEILGKWKFTMPDCNVDVTATAKPLHQIILETVGEGGKQLDYGEGGSVYIGPSCTRAEGQGVDISVLPNPDFDIKTVSVSGAAVTHISTDVNRASYYNFTMPDDDAIITVTFGKTTYGVEWTDPAGGSITVTGIDDDKKAPAGGELTVTIVLESGYTLKGVDIVDAEGKVSAATKSSDGVYTFDMPASNVTVAADVTSDCEVDAAAVSSGTVSVTVTAGDVEAAADESCVDAEALDTLTVDAASVDGDADKAEVQFSAAAVKLLKADSSDIVVQTDVGDVTLTSAAADKGSGGFKLVIERSEETVKVADADVTNIQVLDVSLVTLSGDPITVTGLDNADRIGIDFKLGTWEEDNAKVLYIENGEAASIVDASAPVTGDDGSRVVAFTTSHLSRFAVVDTSTSTGELDEESDPGAAGGSGGGGDGAASSPVKDDPAENGSPADAAANTDATVLPDEGCAADEVKVVDKDGKPVKITRGRDGKYIFRMHAGGAAVTAIKEGNGGVPPDANVFTDVENGDWFADAVKYAYDSKLMVGTSGSTFDPNGIMNRAEVAMILYRMNGSPSTEGLENKFSDVRDDEWYTDAVLWCSSNGKMIGCDDGTFGVSDAATREQIAIIFMRQMGGGERGDISGFSDADEVDSWAVDAMRWAVAAGIIKGNGSGLDPLGNTTRSAMAQILMNAKAVLGDAPPSI